MDADRSTVTDHETDCPAKLRKSRRGDACGYDLHTQQFKCCCETTVEQPVLVSKSSRSPLPADCGNSGGSSIFPKIANGRSVERGAWPWAAVLGQKQSDGSVRWLCGGALIGARHVLTSAHCLANSPDQLLVRLGEHDLDAADDGEHQDRGVRRAVRHPDYMRSSNDVALLELDRPAELCDTVAPVCLPEPTATLASRDGWAVGWGELSYRGAAANVLQEAFVTVVPVEECEATYRQTPQYSFRFPGGFSGGVLCAADYSGQGMDACRGDSGGPLSVLGPDGRYQLAGLVLEGFGCGGATFPGLYTRVANYVDWIRREVSR
ncbi:venom protease-like [Pollicipes pollicipes]|uniref:venom protease-like n=1 Tax=Pollicipes pollicipes TaxID=41117 RepID=UPI001884C82A|nr:venom protease-like [Pollicipes pollicipes]